MQRDPAGTKQRSDRRKKLLRTSPAGRFAGDDDPGVASENFAERPEFTVIEVMKNQVTEHDRVAIVVSEMAQVGDVPRPIAGPIRGARAAVDPVGGDAARRQAPAQLARPRAKLQSDFAFAQETAQRPREPAVVSQDLIREPQIAAAVDGLGILGRKRVEELGFENSPHG